MRLSYRDILGTIIGLVITMVVILTFCPKSAAAASDFSEEDLLLLKIPLNQASYDKKRFLKHHGTQVQANFLLGVPVSSTAESKFAMKYDLMSLFHSQTGSAKKAIEQHFNLLKSNIIPEKWRDRANFSTGSTSFLSSPMTRGMDVEPAKLVGVSVDGKEISFGGGYTWGDHNPALVRQHDPDQGFVLGLTLKKPTWSAQASYLSTGQDVGVYKFSGTKQQSLMLGINYQLSNGLGVSGMLRYQNEEVNNRQRDGITVTFGTRIKF